MCVKIENLNKKPTINCFFINMCVKTENLNKKTNYSVAHPLSGAPQNKIILWRTARWMRHRIRYT